MKLINIGSTVDTLIGDYFGDNWDFIIIGNDARVLEFIRDTEFVLGIVSLVHEDASYGHTGADEIPFTQVNPGEVWLFHTPSHQGTFHVSPCAIVFGSSSCGGNATN